MELALDAASKAAGADDEKKCKSAAGRALGRELKELLEMLKKLVEDDVTKGMTVKQLKGALKLHRYIIDQSIARYKAMIEDGQRPNGLKDVNLAALFVRIQSFIGHTETDTIAQAAAFTQALDAANNKPEILTLVAVLTPVITALGQAYPDPVAAQKPKDEGSNIVLWIVLGIIVVGFVLLVLYFIFASGEEEEDNEGLESLGEESLDEKDIGAGKKELVETSGRGVDVEEGRGEEAREEREAVRRSKKRRGDTGQEGH